MEKLFDISTQYSTNFVVLFKSFKFSVQNSIFHFYETFQEVLFYDIDISINYHNITILTITTNIHPQFMEKRLLIKAVTPKTQRHKKRKYQSISYN